MSRPIRHRVPDCEAGVLFSRLQWDFHQGDCRKEQESAHGGEPRILIVQLLHVLALWSWCTAKAGTSKRAKKYFQQPFPKCRVFVFSPYWLVWRCSNYRSYAALPKTVMKSRTQKRKKTFLQGEKHKGQGNETSRAKARRTLRAKTRQKLQRYCTMRLIPRIIRTELELLFDPVFSNKAVVFYPTYWRYSAASLSVLPAVCFICESDYIQGTFKYWHGN